MQNARLDETQAGIKIARRNINDLRGAESEEELESLLMKLREETERGKIKWLKTQHSKNEDHGTWSCDFMVSRWGKQWKQ